MQGRLAGEPEEIRTCPNTIWYTTNRILSRSNFNLGLRSENILSDRLSYDMAVLFFYPLHHKLWALHTQFRRKHTINMSIFAYAFPSLFALLVWADDLLASIAHITSFISLRIYVGIRSTNRSIKCIYCTTFQFSIGLHSLQNVVIKWSYMHFL
jgi:hypothetical protein